MLVLKDSHLPHKRELGPCPKLVRTVMYFAKQKKSRAVEGLLLGKINQNSEGSVDWNLVEFCQVGRL